MNIEYLGLLNVGSRLAFSGHGIFRSRRRVAVAHLNAERKQWSRAIHSTTYNYHYSTHCTIGYGVRIACGAHHLFLDDLGYAPPVTRSCKESAIDIPDILDLAWHTVVTVAMQP